MEPQLTREQMETRRLLAGRLLLQGKGVTEVADLVGVAKSSVSRWKKTLTQGGQEALRARRAAGAKPRLTAQQQQRLLRILLRGPRKAGYTTELWTCPRVAAVIQQVFGVKYHPDHVWRLLHKLGWSCQQPEQRARERDDRAIQRWREQEWPRIKRGQTSSS